MKFAKWLSVVSFLVLVSTGARADLTIVSDFDDTIKISHSTSPLDTVYRSIFKRGIYAGTSEFFRGLSAANPNSKFVVLSNSPTLLAAKVKKVLDINKFPARTVLLRNWLKTSSKKHKIGALEKLAATTTGPFILFGDDTEHDSDVYAEFTRRHPERVIAALIHRVAGKPIQAGHLSWFTAFDLAYEDVRLGLLDVPAALDVGVEVLTAPSDHLFPKFAFCPKAADLASARSATSDSASLESMRIAVTARVERICRDR